MRTLENNTLVWKASKSEPGEVLLLPKIIQRSYCTYKLFKRGQNCLIYEQSMVDGRTAYEIFIIKIEPPTRFPSGNYLPAREKWPNASAWGTWAWTCTLERALIRFNELEGIGDEQ